MLLSTWLIARNSKEGVLSCWYRQLIPTTKEIVINVSFISRLPTFSVDKRFQIFRLKVLPMGLDGYIKDKMFLRM